MMGTVTIIGAMNPILKLIMRIIQRTTGENNFRNYENKVPKSKKERVRNILNHYE